MYIDYSIKKRSQIRGEDSGYKTVLDIQTDRNTVYSHGLLNKLLWYMSLLLLRKLMASIFYLNDERYETFIT